MRSLLLYWLPPFGWAIVIFYLSSLPGETVLISHINWVEQLSKNFLHICEYGFFSLLVYRALKNTVTWPLPKLRIRTFLICFLYAITDEYHQTYTPGRTGGVPDLIFDFIGINLALILSGKYAYLLPDIVKSILKKVDILE